MKRRGKVVALWTATVGIMVLAAAGFVMGDRLREEWYLWQLGRGSPEHRYAAAKKLYALNSVRVIPALCREIPSAAPECATSLANALVIYCPTLFPRVAQSFGCSLSGNAYILELKTTEDILYVLRTVRQSSVFTVDAHQAAADALKRIQR